MIISFYRYFLNYPKSVSLIFFLTLIMNIIGVVIDYDDHDLRNKIMVSTL